MNTILITNDVDRSFSAPSLIDELVESREGWGGALNTSKN